jgi:hypothetical protein
MADDNSTNLERELEDAQAGRRSQSAASLSAIRRLQNSQRCKDALDKYYLQLRNETEIPWLQDIEQKLDGLVNLQAVLGQQSR